MAYATDPVVLDLSSKFQALITADAQLVARVSASHADPVIDAKLYEHGAPFTGTTPPLIVLIASLMTASWIWNNKLSQADKRSPFAEWLWSEAMRMLDAILDGSMQIAEVSVPDALTFGDLNPVWQEDAIVVGDDLDWMPRVETRE